jgi:hypothetical protein
MATGTQMQTVWVPWIRNLVEMRETHLAEVKHQGELKLLHPEPLAHGSSLHDMIHLKNKRAPTPLLSTRSPPCWPSRPLPHGPSRLLPCRTARPTVLRPDRSLPCRPTRLLPAHWPTRMPGCCLPASPPAYQLPPATGGVQHHQMQAPNWPRRHRQTGLDAKGIAPELLRLKLYCSWTGNVLKNSFFFFFL